MAVAIADTAGFDERLPPQDYNPRMARRSRPVMTLVTEGRLSDFIAPPEGERGPRSQRRGRERRLLLRGVRQRPADRADPSRAATRLHRHSWFGRTRQGDGYEDIAFNPYTRRFFLLIEAEKHPDGTYKALIDECDERANYKRRRWVDVSFEKRNTGFEGLSAVRWKGRDYLLALCEGNRCRAGRKGRKPGGGRIHVLRCVGTVWKSVATIALPPSVKFEDYAAVALRGSRIAVVSQQTSRMWIGTLRFSDWTIAGKGRIYDFPSTKKGKMKYLHARRPVLALAEQLRDGIGPLQGLPREAL